MRAVVAAAVRRESSVGDARTHPHRMPIGLMLLEQGQISAPALKTALAAWKRHGEETGEAVRLGRWLVESGQISEAALLRGLSAQWSCPALSLARFRAGDTAAVLPRILCEAYGAVPVRMTGGVYLAFAGAVDRGLSYAVGRITGLRVTAGLARDGEWQQAEAEYRGTAAPPAQYLEAADAAAMVRALAGRIEAGKAAEARLVRVHEFWWLRLWRRATAEPGLAGCGDVEDVVCALRRGGLGY